MSVIDEAMAKVEVDYAALGESITGLALVLPTDPPVPPNPPDPPPAGPVISNPSIELSAAIVGVRMLRKVGEPKDPAWRADAGWWYTGLLGSINENAQLIGTQAECIYTGLVGNGARYRERYTNGTEFAYRWSAEVGPFMPYEPPPVDPVSPSLQRLLDSMTLPNDGGMFLASPPTNYEMTADKNGPGGKTWAYIQRGIRRADGGSYWPGVYLSDLGLSRSTRIRRLCWWVVCRAQQQQAGQAMNTRMWMANLGTWLLRRSGQWTKGGSSGMNDDRIQANWHANFSSPGNEKLEPISSGPGLYDSRKEPGGGVTLGGIGQGDRAGWAAHGWPCEDALTLGEWLDDVVGVVQFVDQALTLQNPAGPDDRDKAKLLQWFGADWYNGNSYIGEHCHARLQLLTSERQPAYLTDLPASVLRANPPPGF